MAQTTLFGMILGLGSDHKIDAHPVMSFYMVR